MEFARTNINKDELSALPTVKVETVRALKDNYCYLVHRADSDRCLVIDTSEFAPIQTEIERLHLKLDLILNTHHHPDHVLANTDLCDRWEPQVFCSDVDVDRIPHAQKGLRDQERFEFDGIEIQTLAIPGHTRGQIAFHFPAHGLVFVGDTLFSMGCGRILEGTPKKMYESLQKLAELPDSVKLHFGHEYTEKNGAFARNVEPGNRAIQDRLRATRESLSQGTCAAAPNLGDEKRVNPFLRLNSPSLRRQLDMVDATDFEVFTSLRRLRDGFQG